VFQPPGLREGKEGGRERAREKDKDRERERVIFAHHFGL
jgi:hypothetical protein